MKEQIECKHLVLRPKKIRAFGVMDTCIHFKNIKGFHLTYDNIPNKECPFFMICKYFEMKKE